jgi:hypothetical protein
MSLGYIATACLQSKQTTIHLYRHSFKDDMLKTIAHEKMLNITNHFGMQIKTMMR